MQALAEAGIVKTIVVKDLSEGDSIKDIEKAAKAIIATLEKGGFRNVRVAYGTIVNEIKEVSRSFKEAKMALDVSRIFFEDRTVIAYNELGIGRLIYQLPIPLCKMFIREIFKGKNPDDFLEDFHEPLGEDSEWDPDELSCPEEAYVGHIDQWDHWHG